MPLKMGKIIKQFKEYWSKLSDKRKASNRTNYTMTDAALSAFAVFFMQCPSFLAFQRDMKKKKKRSNAEMLFAIENVPCDQQVKNILDPLEASEIDSAYKWVLSELEVGDYLEEYKCIENTMPIALDGLTYHSSTKIHCDCCSTRRDSQGTMHYYHHAILAVITRPDCPHVLPLPPEFISPQDGHEKQDCEREATKRWLTKHDDLFQPFTVTYLGDDLYSNQPLCQQIVDISKQYFVFVCKPDSHTTLYEEVALLDKIDGLETKKIRVWNGEDHDIWTYRWTTHLPLRAGEDALYVNWCELNITNEKSGKRVFMNAWVTNHVLTSDNVAAVCKVGRTRWKVENEAINILKNQGYHLEHNFGHGNQHLSSTLFSLNLLAFLVHTALHLADLTYQLLRQELGPRRTFFSDIDTLTRYHLFSSWSHLFDFMMDGLDIDPAPT